MTPSSARHLLLPLFVLCITSAVIASVPIPARAAPAPTLQVVFGTAPQWGFIPGMQVQEIRRGDRLGYDVFRYGNRYYAYERDRWYSSNRMNGTYTLVATRNVPRQLHRVPAQYWKHYPAARQNGMADHGRSRGSNGRGAQSRGSHRK